MSINLHFLKCAFAVYLAPLHQGGPFLIWRNRHWDYRGGWVARILWLGLVIRWGKRRRYVGGILEEDTF